MNVNVTYWCVEMHCDEDMYATERTLLGVTSSDEESEKMIRQYIDNTLSVDNADDSELPKTCSQEAYEEVYGGFFEVQNVEVDTYIAK